MSQGVDPEARRIIARAWRDEHYRNQLPAEVREKLPPAPEGVSRLSDAELEAAAGGTTIGCAALAIGAVAMGVQAEEAWD